MRGSFGQRPYPPAHGQESAVALPGANRFDLANLG
jgi:hypothetical protein